MNRKDSDWPQEASLLARELHSKLTLSDKDWHKQKGKSHRRSAELLAGALVQLINGGRLSDIEAMTTQGLLWLKDEVRDPGCPRK